MRPRPVLRPLILIATALAVAAAERPATATERHVGPGQAYATIQAAVDAAVAGDTVTVHDGTYQENVVVATRITLRSLDWVLFGENDGAVIDAGLESGFGILVTADGTDLAGFSVHGAGGYAPFGHHAGIGVIDADSCRLTGNRCGWDAGHRNDAGMMLFLADHLEVTGNEVAFGKFGFWIGDSGGGEYRDNVARDFRTVANSSGFYLLGTSVKDVSTTERNLIENNQVFANNVGVYLATGASRNTIAGNSVTDHFVGVLVEEGSNENVFSANTIRDNQSRGLQINGASHNTVTDNTVDGNGFGIWLGYAEPFDLGGHANTVAFNSITGSTWVGLRISPLSAGNRIYLNDFVDNTAHVRAAASLWSTPAEVSYFHGGANYLGHLGNHYDTYAGIDTDGDGVGDTDLPFRDGDPVDGPDEDHPLVAPTASFALQAWFLGGEAAPVMRCGDLSAAIGEVAIPVGGGVVWTSAAAATANLAFAAAPWTGRLRTLTAIEPGQLTVEIGTVVGGGGFTPGGPTAVVDTGGWETIFATSATAMTVPAGHHLALRLNILGPANCLLWAGGGMSYLTSPGFGDPHWPGGGTAVPPASGSAVTVGQNRPNPFNPRTVIPFELPADALVELVIHDLAGRRVRTLMQGTTLAAGSHTAVWNGRDDHGRPVAAGTYLGRLTAAGHSRYLKLSLIR